MNNHNALSFLRLYVEENKNAFHEGVEYVDNRGFIDGFGIESILEGTAKQSFAQEFSKTLDLGDEASEAGEDPEWDARVEYVLKSIERLLKNTSLFGSSSYGTNTLEMYKLREAQRLADRMEWFTSLDKAGMNLTKNA